MDLGLQGRTAVVTGASAGIGREIARSLGAEGVRVALVARRRADLEEVAAQMLSAGMPEPVVIDEDLADRDAPGRVRERALAGLGGVDFLINNAGQADPVGVELDEDGWRASFELNFHAKRRLAQELRTSMAERGQGRVVNMVGLLEPTVVTAAQPAVAACILWAKAWSRSVAAEGITVNGIAPGRVDSEQVRRHFPTPESQAEFASQFIPVGRFGRPEEVASLVLFLCSSSASYLTGETISLDGGMHRRA